MIPHGTVRYRTTLRKYSDTCSESTQVSANVRIHVKYTGTVRNRTEPWTTADLRQKVRSCSHCSSRAQCPRTAMCMCVIRAVLRIMWTRQSINQSQIFLWLAPKVTKEWIGDADGWLSVAWRVGVVKEMCLQSRSESAQGARIADGSRYIVPGSQCTDSKSMLVEVRRGTRPVQGCRLVPKCSALGGCCRCSSHAK